MKLEEEEKKEMGEQGKKVDFQGEIMSQSVIIITYIYICEFGELGFNVSGQPLFPLSR